MDLAIDLTKLTDDFLRTRGLRMGAIGRVPTSCGSIEELGASDSLNLRQGVLSRWEGFASP